MTSDMSDVEKTVVIPSPEEPGSYISVALPASTLNSEIMDVGFTSSTGSGNYPGGMEALKAVHRFADPVPLGGNWRYKYSIDFDGMGYSARYPALLASDSAVIKSTVYKEYYEDWIQPWWVMHFGVFFIRVVLMSFRSGYISYRFLRRTRRSTIFTHSSPVRRPVWPLYWRRHLWNRTSLP